MSDLKTDSRATLIYQPMDGRAKEGVKIQEQKLCPKARDKTESVMCCHDWEEYHVGLESKVWRPCEMCEERLRLKEHCAGCSTSARALDGPNVWGTVCHLCDTPICTRCCVSYSPDQMQMQDRHCSFCHDGEPTMVCSTCALTSGQTMRCDECGKISDGTQACYVCQQAACHYMWAYCGICRNDEREEDHQWLCCRHWRELPICPNCPNQSSSLCLDHRISCITCDRMAGCTGCTSAPNHRQCPGCRQATQQMIFEESDLPKVLAQELYKYLYESKSISFPGISRPRMGVVDEKGDLVYILSSWIEKGCLASQAIAWSPWESRPVKLRTGEYWTRPLTSFKPLLGPFTVHNTHLRSELFRSELCLLQDASRTSFYARKNEVDMIVKGPIHRPLIYEQDVHLEIAYWTFDRRDLFDTRVGTDGK